MSQLAKSSRLGVILALAALSLVTGASIAGCNLGSSAGRRVDLRPSQTSGAPSSRGLLAQLRDQGGGYTCITFSATAAMEAAYKRQFGLELDLSEGFLNYMGKMNWLRYELGPGDYDENRAENQVSAFGGGNGVGWLKALTEGFASPIDSNFPYVATYDLTTFCPGCQDYRDAYWTSQRNVDDFNLDPGVLPISALTADSYYSVVSYAEIEDITDPDAYESVLDAGHEIVWDTYVANTDGAMWLPCASGQMNCPSGAHSMLIVGYDTTDARNPYFIVKNSWGLGSSYDDDGDGSGDGWTRVAYGYLQHSISAGYITEVAEPHSWPELKFIGRWNLSIDGSHGLLDIYHVPGVRTGLFASEGVGATDMRLGTYFDESGDAFRVNGSVNGSTLEFYLNPENPRLRYDSLTGTRFRFHLFRQDTDAMAGFLATEAGTLRGGYALRCPGSDWPDCSGNYLNADYDSPRPLEPESWIGLWEVIHDGRWGQLTIFERNDALATGSLAGMAAFEAEWAGGGLPARDVTVTIDPDDPRRISFVIPFEGGSRRLRGLHLNDEPGVAAGESDERPKIGFYMYRLSARLIARIIQPDHRVLSRARQELFEVEVISDPRWECCTFHWESDRDGSIGFEQRFAKWGYEFRPGVHRITVDVFDTGGNRVRDAIEVEVPENLAPTVHITQPGPGSTYEQSQVISFAGTSTDADHPPAFRLDEDEVHWYLDGNSSPFGSGHTASLSGLSIGPHTIRFEGSDGQASDSDQVSVKVIEDQEDLSPSAQITSPSQGASFNANVYDADLDQWYVNVTLQGTGTDPEDGSLSGGSLVWTGRVNGGSVINMGTGTSSNVRLYAPMCFGNNYQISLTVTDSAGNMDMASINITVTLFC